MRLLEVKEPEAVLRLIRETFGTLSWEQVSLNAAGGRVTAEEVRAPEDVPGFDRSLVDGYALQAANTFGAGESFPALLQLDGHILMGEPAPPLPPGRTMYIPTGGMLPQGADAVVMLEDTALLGDLVNCYKQVAPGENVVRRGEDLIQGQIAIPPGRRMRAAEIGLLAALGVGQLKVTRRPLVGILATGDEIVPNQTAVIKTGQVRDCNSPALGEMVRLLGAEAIYGGILEDRYEVFLTEITSLLARVDFLVLSGGSSVGTSDYTWKIMEELSGGKFLAAGLAVQPGKPTLLADCGGKPVLGLPGHPVSALNVFNILGTAIIQSLLGLAEQPSPTVRAILSRNVPSSIGRTDYVRVRLTETAGGLAAIPVFGRSTLLRTLAEAQGVVIVPAGSEGLNAGSEVEVHLR